MHCEDFVDRRWMKTMERRRRDMQALDKMRQLAQSEHDGNQETLVDSEQSDGESQQDVVDEDEYGLENSTRLMNLLQVQVLLRNFQKFLMHRVHILKVTCQKASSCS